MSRIQLNGCLNFRDLGGYPTPRGGHVRRGILYRSDALHHLTPEDVRVVRDELRIGDILDLRSSGELRSEGRGPLEREPIRFHHVPLFDGDTGAARDQHVGGDLAGRYFLLAEFAKPAIARTITILAESDDAVVYHCAAGKDRTGVISAILLGLLGVEDEVIVADYALSAENLDAIIDRLMESEGYQAMFEELPPETLHANPETMRGFLGHLHGKYATVSDYARSAGISDASVERLRRRMLQAPDVLGSKL